MDNQWEYGKSPHKFFYTYNDIAKVSKLSYNTIKQYASQNRFKPEDLESIIQFVSKRRKNENKD